MSSNEFILWMCTNKKIECYEKCEILWVERSHSFQRYWPVRFGAVYSHNLLLSFLGGYFSFKKMYSEAKGDLIKILKSGKILRNHRPVLKTRQLSVWVSSGANFIELLSRKNCSTTDRRTSQHAFRFLRVFCLPHVAVTFVGRRVYTQLFLGVRGNMLRCTRTKGTAVNEWVHTFVDFCLIPYPRPIPFTFQPQICKDGFICIVFDVSPECCLFDRVRADNRPVLWSLQRY